MASSLKARPRKSRLFSALRKQVGSDHEHSEVQGKALTRLLGLRGELRLFLINSKFELTHY
jgi:hypothetical protein